MTQRRLRCTPEKPILALAITASALLFTAPIARAYYQTPDPKSPVVAQPIPELKVGSYVVLKTSAVKLTDDGREVACRADDVYLRIERIDRDRLFVTSRDGKRAGWLSVDQVVPYASVRSTTSTRRLQRVPQAPTPVGGADNSGPPAPITTARWLISTRQSASHPKKLITTWIAATCSF